MIVLALDTTSEFGSLALRSNGETVAELTIHSPEGFAHLIFPAIDQLLDQAKVRLEKWVRLEEIDLFAAAAGPGSFTGVRIGLSAVKGLAEAMGKPAAGISNLQVLSSFGNLPLRAVVLDARRGEVYAAIYNAALQPIAPEAAWKFPDWLNSLHEAAYQFISPSPLPLAGTRFEEMPFVQSPRHLAPALAACAERDGGQDPAALDANYVRRSDAELFWRER